MPGIYRMEIQAMAGGGKLSASGAAPREPVRGSPSTTSRPIRPGQRIDQAGPSTISTCTWSTCRSGRAQALTLASFIALCSAALGKPVQSRRWRDGRHEPGRHHGQVRNLAESLQVAFDAGAKKILLPMSSVTDIPSVPGELFAKFQTSFYSDPVDAVFKALGVEYPLGY
jgi:ATP-dependent Lon protease